MKIHPVRTAAVASLFSLVALLSVSPRRSHADLGLKVTDKNKSESFDKDGKSQGADEKEEETRASCA